MNKDEMIIKADPESIQNSLEFIVANGVTLNSLVSVRSYVRGGQRGARSPAQAIVQVA